MNGTSKSRPNIKCSIDAPLKTAVAFLVNSSLALLCHMAPQLYAAPTCPTWAMMEGRSA